MSGDADPISEREAALKVMLAGQWEGVRADDAQRGVSLADENRKGGFGGRTLGFGVISAQGRGDGVEYLVAVTDGERQAAIRARLSGTRLAILGGAGEDPATHVVGRLQDATGSLPNDGNRYKNMLLQEQPITFG
jgi:hypothetical protein